MGLMLTVMFVMGLMLLMNKEGTKEGLKDTFNGDLCDDTDSPDKRK